jgi:hypothetical protein
LLVRLCDVPWLFDTGPRAARWYFGDWSERLSRAYWLHLVLDWLRDSRLMVVVPALAVLAALQPRLNREEQRPSLRPDLTEAIRRATPFLAALFVYTFLWYSVFKAHEYYVLPVNVLRALTAGALLSLLCGSARPRAVAWLIATVVVGHAAYVGGRDYLSFARAVNDPATSFYYQEWGVQVFPRKNSFVVMAVPGTGRDLLHLYLAKSRGLLWCAHNPVYAPRAFWKEQGVEYVAWAVKYDPKTQKHTWVVRTLDEELKVARKNGWSSDVKDVWAGKSMAEWAALASRTGSDPCFAATYDPRKWRP